MKYPTTLIIAALFCSTAVAAPEPVTCDSPCDCHNAHGEGRWSVKTDASLPPTDASAIQAVTPSEMFGWPGPDAALTMQSERTGIENKWFALTGRVVELKVEEDGDLHIALHDVTGDKPGVVVCEYLQNHSGARFAQPFLVGLHTVSFSHWHCEEADLRSISYHYGDRQSVLGCRPCTERSKQPSKIHAGLRCLGDSSGDETDCSLGDSAPKTTHRHAFA